MKIWRNGGEVDSDQYIADLEREIQVYKDEIKKLNQAETFINEAITEHFVKVYRPLAKFKKDYGDLENLREMYGYGYISKAKYERTSKEIETMTEERKEMGALINDLNITSVINRRIQKYLEYIKNCQARILDVDNEVAGG